MTTSDEGNYTIEVRQLEPAPALVERFSSPASEIAKHLGRIFGETVAFLQRPGMPQPLAAFARYTMQPGDVFDVEAGFTATGPIDPSGLPPGMEVIELPGGPAAVCLHVGSYDSVAGAYNAIVSWVTANSRKASGPPWEVYLSMPDEVPPRTEVYQPLEA